MIKRFAKLLMIVLAMILAFTTIACDGCNKDEGSTDVSLKTPGAVLSNGGAVIRTDNYFYYVNGIAPSNADNSYGTPKKGAIMVVDINDMSNPQVVVPKMVTAEDYTAGIYMFGEYIYYGTTTTKKDTDGNIAYGNMEFQKAKIDGSSVEEVLLVEGHDLKFRFVESSGVVYLVYVEVVDGKTNIVCYNTSNGSSSTIASDVASYNFVENAYLDKAVVIYTKNVIDDDSEQDLGYNEVYAYKVGAEPSKILTGDKTVTTLANNVTYTVSAVKAGYLFVSESAVASNAKDYAISLSDFTAKTEIKNVDAIANAYIVSLNEIYFPSTNDLSSGSCIIKGALAKTGIDNEIVSDDKAVNIIAHQVVGTETYLYYVDDQSYLCVVKADKNPQETFVLSDKALNTSWYENGIKGDYLFFTDASEYGKDYIKAIKLNIDFANDFEHDDNLDAKVLKDSKVINLAWYEDADKADVFEAMLIDYQSVAYDSNQRVKVRDENNVLITKDGRIYSEQFDGIVAFYGSLTSDQKDLIESSAMDGYNLYVECFKVNNILLSLEGFNNANKAGSAESWLSKVEAAKTAMDAYIANNADYKSVFNMVDNNLMWEYYGGSDIQGALAWYNAR